MTDEASISVIVATLAATLLKYAAIAVTKQRTLAILLIISVTVPLKKFGITDKVGEIARREVLNSEVDDLNCALKYLRYHLVQILLQYVLKMM